MSISSELQNDLTNLQIWFALSIAIGMIISWIHFSFIDKSKEIPDAIMKSALIFALTTAATLVLPFTIIFTVIGWTALYFRKKRIKRENVKC